MKTFIDKMHDYAVKLVKKEEDKWLSGMHNNYFNYAEEFDKMLFYLDGRYLDVLNENTRLRREVKELKNKLYGRG